MRILTAAFVVLLSISTMGWGQTISGRLMIELEQASAEEKIPVIIELERSEGLRPFLQQRNSIRKMSKEKRRIYRAELLHSLRNRARQEQKQILRFLRSQGVASPKSLWINNSIVAELAPEVVHLLASMPGISSIKADVVVRLPQIFPAATAGIEDNINLVNAPALWALGYDGTGMTVATMDSGVDLNHPDLGSRWRGHDGLGSSWFDPHGEHPVTPHDADGHGTAVLGVLVGGNAGGTSIGVAPGAQWIAVKIFDDADSSRNSMIHEGYQWLLDPDNNPATDDAPDVVNNSWGFELNAGECIETADPNNPGSDFDSDFHPDLQALRAAGIAVVFSAGNAGPAPNTDVSPGNYPEAFAVGSVDPLSADLSFSSSRGPSACDGSIFPEIVAPGDFIRSADLTFGGIFPNSYAQWFGTSFAAPHAAGIMSLLMQAFPQASLADIEAGILSAGMDLGAPGADNDYGFGLIDGLSAYDSLAQSLSLYLVSPNAGDIFTAGENYNVRWTAVSGAVSYRLRYFDADGTVHVVANVGNVTNFNWTIPFNTVAETGKSFRVTAFDASGNLIGLDRSDGTFTVNPSLLSVVSPNGGETLTAGESYNVQWRGHSGADSYRLRYIDADKTVHVVANVGNVTDYIWTIPVNVVVEAGKLFRVSAIDSNNSVLAVDRSDRPFTIGPAPGSLLTPNGGEVYFASDPPAIIQWLAHPDAVSYRLRYFDADGTIHAVATIGNVTSYAWEIPATVKIEAGKQFRVTGVDAAGAIVSVDRSDGTFQISP